MRTNEELRVLVWDLLKGILKHTHGPLPHLRLTTKEWRNMLIENDDKGYIIEGEVYNAEAISIGCGVQSIVFCNNARRQQ